MPIYEYECPSCGKFEVIQKASESELKECPQCKEKGKKSKAQRVVSASAFHLKGGGWYKDLYSTPKKESASSGDSGSTATKSDSGSSAGTTDAAPKKAGCGTTCGCG